MRTFPASLVLFVLAGVAGWDLVRAERSTIVVYTTPALRDLLERQVIPAFSRSTGYDVTLVYVPAGQQYNRLRMSGRHPEADLFLHASPLYLEKAYASGHVDPAVLAGSDRVPARFKSRMVGGGQIWTAFAWSPLVAVHRADRARSPDLATSDRSFGFPHPVLSNNGIYCVLFFEHASPDAGRRALGFTRVQPANARANIGGIADQSFELTLGYEAVVRFYQAQGAPIAYELPVIDAKRMTTPVLFSVALIGGERHRGAEQLAIYLLTPAVQNVLGKYQFRSVFPGAFEPEDLVDVEDRAIEIVDYDWAKWEALEHALARYEVKK